MKYSPLHFLYGCLLLAAVTVTSVWQPFRHLVAWAQPGSGCQTFSQTGQTVCGKFLIYWNTHGGLAQQGYPISPEFVEVSELNGQPYTVQYFERAVFEFHPENQPPYDVLLSQLGTYQAKRKYGDPPTWPGAPPPTPVPPPTVGSAVTLRDGVNLTLVASYDDRATGLGTASCGGAAMRWVFRLDNNSASGYVVNFDNTTATMSDSTGRNYEGQSNACNGGLQYIGYDAFASPVTLAPKQVTRAQAVFLAPDFPQDAAYFDLRFTLSGTPLIFRYPLR